MTIDISDHSTELYFTPFCDQYSTVQSAIHNIVFPVGGTGKDPKYIPMSMRPCPDFTVTIFLYVL